MFELVFEQVNSRWRSTPQLGSVSVLSDFLQNFRSSSKVQQPVSFIQSITFLKQNLKGLTELDTDVEASSVIPDASESTIADNDDRADFLAQTTSGYIPAPQVKLNLFQKFNHYISRLI